MKTHKKKHYNKLDDFYERINDFYVKRLRQNGDCYDRIDDFYNGSDDFYDRMAIDDF